MDGTAKLKYCPYCMELGNMEGAVNCPHCHHSLEDMGNGKEELPVYAVIDSRYMTGKSRESNGEDFIIYIGLDLTEKRRVWIREFFCRSLAYRKQESPNIHTYAGQKEAYLEKYDACVRKFQKAGGDKKIAFANGTVYQITSLSEEEASALCQDSDPAEGQSSDTVKNEEGKILPESRERKNRFPDIISSRKVKAVVLAVLAICLVASLLQKYHLGKISAGENRNAKSASTSYQPKGIGNPAPIDCAQPSASPMPTDCTDSSESPGLSDRAKASIPPAGDAKESEVPVPTEEPARPKADRKSPTPKASKKSDARSSKKSPVSEPTKKPDAKAEKKSPVPEPIRKPVSKATKKPARKSKKKNTQKPRKKKSKKKKSVIDDNSLDKKVYEIE